MVCGRRSSKNEVEDRGEQGRTAPRTSGGLGEKPGSAAEKGTAHAFSGWGVKGEGPEGPVSPGETDVTAGAEQLGVRPAARGAGLARGWSSAEGAGQWGGDRAQEPQRKWCDDGQA